MKQSIMHRAFRPSRHGAPCRQRSFSRAEEDDRIRRERQRVEAEMAELGIHSGEGSLHICRCGRESVRGRAVDLERGWAEVEGVWLCPRCAKGERP